MSRGWPAGHPERTDRAIRRIDDNLGGDCQKNITYAYNEDSALAIEHQAELHSNDADFSRFSGLTWRNPIA